MQVSVHKKGWMDEEGIYLFACLFSFCFVTYQITEHVLSSTYHIYANLTSLVFSEPPLFYKSQWPTLCILLFAWNRTSNCDKKILFRENIHL